MKNSFLTYIIVIFVLLTAIFYGVKIEWPQYNFKLLMAGNIIMAILSMITFFIVNQKINDRAQVFVRGIYSASFLKLIVCMASVLIYVLLNRDNVHKASVLILFAIYAIYTAVETWYLSKLARNIK